METAILYIFWALFILLTIYTVYLYGRKYLDKFADGKGLFPKAERSQPGSVPYNKSEGDTYEENSWEVTVIRESGDVKNVKKGKISPSFFTSDEDAEEEVHFKIGGGKECNIEISGFDESVKGIIAYIRYEDGKFYLVWGDGLKSEAIDEGVVELEYGISVMFKPIIKA